MIGCINAWWKKLPKMIELRRVLWKLFLIINKLFKDVSFFFKLFSLVFLLFRTKIFIYEWMIRRSWIKIKLLRIAKVVWCCCLIVLSSRFRSTCGAQFLGQIRRILPLRSTSVGRLRGKPRWILRSRRSIYALVGQWSWSWW